MDPRERFGDSQLALMAALDGRQAQIWTALPAIVTGFSSADMTVDVRPAIKAMYRDPRDPLGQYTPIELPMLRQCPVQFPSAGGFTITFPVATGDECLAIIASRCIDAWWQNGGVQPQAEMRMHDLSDGMVILGFRSKPNALAQFSDTGMRLRTDDPELAYIELTKDGRIIMYAKEGFFLNGGNGQFNLSGDLNAVGTIRGIEVKATQRNVSLNTHVHSGVQAGGSNTAIPVTGT